MTWMKKNDLDENYKIERKFQMEKNWKTYVETPMKFCADSCWITTVVFGKSTAHAITHNNEQYNYQQVSVSASISSKKTAKIDKKSHELRLPEVKVRMRQFSSGNLTRTRHIT